MCLGGLNKKVGKQKIAITTYALYTVLRHSMSGVRNRWIHHDNDAQLNSLLKDMVQGLSFNINWGH